MGFSFGEHLARQYRDAHGLLQRDARHVRAVLSPLRARRIGPTYLEGWRPRPSPTFTCVSARQFRGGCDQMPPRQLVPVCHARRLWDRRPWAYPVRNRARPAAADHEEPTRIRAVRGSCRQVEAEEHHIRRCEAGRTDSVPDVVSFGFVTAPVAFAA